MQRFNRTFRQTIRNKAKAYEPFLMMRKPVMPNETASIDVKAMVETDLLAALVNPALLSAWAFYVPYRLVYPGWPEWLDTPVTGEVHPTANVAFAPMGEEGVGPFSVLGRRCWKLVYNTFFGDETVAGAYYGNIEADTAVGLLPLSNPTQLIREVRKESAMPSFPYPIDVDTVTGSGEIDLVDLEKARRNAVTGVIQQMSGQSYLDYLYSQGVDVPNGLVGQPEMLGMTQQMIYPTDVRNTGDPTSQGEKVSFYRGSLKLSTKDKYFPEHGLILVIGGLRPLVTLPATSAYPDDYLFDVHKQWTNFDTDPAVIKTLGFAYGQNDDSSEEVWLPAGFQTLFGDVRAINGADGVLEVTAADADKARYPTATLGLQSTSHSEVSMKSPVDTRPRA